MLTNEQKALMIAEGLFSLLMGGTNFLDHYNGTQAEMLRARACMDKMVWLQDPAVAELGFSGLLTGLEQLQRDIKR